MGYRDREKQRAAQHRSYLRNKTAIMERQRQRRAQPSYREKEYARRLGLTVEEYRERERVTAERVPRASRASVTRRKLREALRPRKISPEEQALIDAQRAMKEAALRRLGLKPREESNPRSVAPEETR